MAEFLGCADCKISMRWCQSPTFQQSCYYLSSGFATANGTTRLFSIGTIKKLIVHFLQLKVFQSSFTQTERGDPIDDPS